MDLDTGAETDAEHRSYWRFAHQARLWCARGADRAHASEQERQIWRRITFAALIGNSDDHPRNHALLRDGSVWRLSPIFDVIPVNRGPEEQHATSMPFLRGRQDGNRISVANLVDAAPLYKWQRDEALAEIQRMARIIAARWEETLLKHGAPRVYIEQLRGAFALAASISHEDLKPATFSVTLKSSG